MPEMRLPFDPQLTPKQRAQLAYDNLLASCDGDQKAAFDALCAFAKRQMEARRSMTYDSRWGSSNGGQILAAMDARARDQGEAGGAGGEGRVAIVTGAAQGLGLVIARRLAEEGADIVASDIQEDRLAQRARELQEGTNQRVLPFAGDLSEAGVADAMVRRALDEFGRIDTLVNNAAALIRLKLVDFTEELLQKAVRWNVWNTLRCCKAVLPHMSARHYGRIVNIGGEAWRTGAPYHTLLAGIGKGSMVGLTATLAGEVVRHGITVNCVSPGGIETEADGAKEPLPPGFREPGWTDPEFFSEMRRMGGGRGIGRMAHPTEVAAAVAFFGAPEASFVTGQHLGASGGVAML